jgi:hypothetical protein
MPAFFLALGVGSISVGCVFVMMFLNHGAVLALMPARLKVIPVIKGKT